MFKGLESEETLARNYIMGSMLINGVYLLLQMCRCNYGNITLVFLLWLGDKAQSGMTFDKSVNQSKDPSLSVIS